MRLGSLRIAVLATALITTAGGALAEPMTYDRFNCYAGESIRIRHDELTSAYTFSHRGTSVRRDSEDPEPQSSRCIGLASVIEGAPKAQGYCEFMDGDGNKIFGRFQADALGGEWIIISGTGKNRGIRGAGTFEYLGHSPTFEPGDYQGCVHAKGEYEIPGE